MYNNVLYIMLLSKENSFYASLASFSSSLLESPVKDSISSKE